MTLLSLNTARANGLALVASIAANVDNGPALVATSANGLRNIAASLEGAENAAVPNVLAYGAARSILQFGLNHDAASLDKADKAAIGFKDLPSMSPSKRRLSQYHSAFRTIAENWDTIPQTERDELLAGKRSFLTVRDGIAKREKDAAKAKAAAEAAAEAEQAIEAAKSEGAASVQAAPTGLVEILAATLAAYNAASDDEAGSDEVADMLGQLIAAHNARIDAMTAPTALAA